MAKNNFFHYIDIENTLQIKELLKSYPSMIQSKKEGLTPLMYAIKKNNLVAFELLLNYEQNLNALSSHQDTLLHLSTQVNSLKMTTAILKFNKIDINQLNEYHLPAIYYAANQNNEKICHILIDYGAYINNFDWSDNIYHNYSLKKKLEQYHISQLKEEEKEDRMNIKIKKFKF